MERNLFYTSFEVTALVLSKPARTLFLQIFGSNLSYEETCLPVVNFVYENLTCMGTNLILQFDTRRKNWNPIVV